MGKKKSKERMKELQSELKESASKIWLAGLGALQTAEEEGSKVFRKLVEKGETYEAKGRKAVGDVREDIDRAMGDVRERASGTAEKIEDRLDEVVSSAFQRFGVPSRDEIATLTRRVEELTRVVEGMKGPSTESEAKPTAAKKPAAKKAAVKKPAAKKSSAGSTKKSSAES